jgi:3-hydroxy acid dehydrogenase/malonic semialdehyde reductase
MQGKAVLVTGASSGIGRAVAVRLARDGWHVLALARSAPALEALAREHGAEPIVADLAEPSALAGLLGERPVDAVVHNAGLLTARGPFQSIDPGRIDEHLDINLRAPLHLTRLLLPGMIARGRGHLVFVTSIAARSPHPDIALYAATKAALAHFSDSLRCDLLGTGLRVTDIAPGRVETDLYRDALDEAGRRALYEGVRSLRPEDVAEAVAGVLSLPAHVDVARLELYPTEHAHGGSRVVRWPGAGA